MLHNLPSVANRSAPRPGPLVVKIDQDRRAFLKLAGMGAGGLLLGACFGPGTGANMATAMEPQALNLFLRLSADDTVTIVAHRSEMGQGIRTSLPQILADELEADWQKVKVVQAPGDARFGDQNTDGSRSVRRFFTSMRQLGATAKLMLEQTAAQRWDVPLDQVRAQSHQVLHMPSGRLISFGALASDAAKAPLPKREEVVLKNPDKFKWIGQPLAMVDLDKILQGSAVFGIDVQQEGMLHASIERCPVVGGRLKSLDDREARALKGVVDIIVLPVNSFPIGFAPLHGVAVIAENTWVAQQARLKLKLEWDPGANAGYDSATDLSAMREQVQKPGQPGNGWGNFDQALAQAARSHQAIYTVPYLAHAPMEPPAATAVVNDERCELWVCTQSPQSVQEQVAALLGLDKEGVKVNVTLLGGAFGRKAKADFSLEAALLAKQVARPVKVTWSREDDLRSGYYHAHSAQYFHASMDEAGQVTGWLQRTAFPSILSLFADVSSAPAAWELDLGFHELPLDVPSWQSEVHAVPAHLRIGWLRSVCNIQHAFARSSFIDELAVIARKPAPLFLAELIGQEPQFIPQDKGYQYGNYDEDLQHFPMDRKRLLEVLKVATHLGEWGEMPDGQGWGIAAHRSFLSYVAVATRVSVKENSLQVNEVHIVIDCGRVVNPDRVKSQMEGSVIFGLSLALAGAITVEQGAVKQTNFDTYPLLRMNQSPDIHVHLVESEQPPAGVGEPGVPPVAPSLTNAIYAATGTRIRDLPVNNVLRV